MISILPYAAPAGGWVCIGTPISFWTDGSKARKLHCATKKKVSCEEKRPRDSDSWGPINNPTSADFQDQFVGVSFPSLKFGILACFVLWWFQWKFLKLTDRLIQQRGTFGICFRIFRSQLSPETRFFAGKTWFRHFWSYESRDSGPARARNSNFNNLIDRSKIFF